MGNQLSKFSVILLLFLGAQTATAQVCVTIDESRDSLTKSERKAAIALMENGFRKAGQSVTDAPCDQVFKLSNARLGRTITATIRGPNGARTFQVQRIEDLGAALEQMAHSMVTGSVLGNNSGNSISRHNVMRQQVNPNRVESDALAYIAIGPGVLIGPSLAGEVPVLFTGGLRYELDNAAIDINGQFFANPSDEGGTSVFGNLGFLYFKDPIQNNSAFVGFALGLGGMQASVDEQDFEGGGLHTRLSGGYEFFRASTMRLIVQADLTLPLYTLKYEEVLVSNGPPEPIYAPMFGFSLGGAVSSSPRASKTITVRHL